MAYIQMRRGANCILVGLLWITAISYAVSTLTAHVEKFWKFRSMFIEQFDAEGNHVL